MDAAGFVREMPRIGINSGFNPGTLFDGFNTNIEWNPHNPWGNAANVTSTVICTGLRVYAEIKKIPGLETSNKNFVTRLADNPAFSTAAAGVTQLIVAGTNFATGNYHEIFLPLAFGIGDIVAAFNKEAQPTTTQEEKTKGPSTLRSTVKDVLMTAENYFAGGLSIKQGPLAITMFAVAAGFATARNIPFVSRQLDRLGRVGRQIKNPYTTFGLLAAGCGVAACCSSLHVAMSYVGFGVAYLVIPTFKSGGLYEAARNYFRPPAVHVTPH